ncbi:hypothetical protein PtrM4_057500 [Pyrenophora tritici-repentis]|uniref:Uncharacterized protein n=1 Tax=Pyrenophora tritici-repentis TaxID=45151 RepID=A0A834S601_9PLEO|nr:hypothetical protein PtrM4_057500 [Pyrenophora tritici-repentis]KAI0571407.1 hypothetical protein Alg215_10421 [Pyrenophora tritici-repentis]
MASGALARRDEPSNVYDQFRLLDVHLLNLTTTARALRIRLRVLWSYSVALERRAKETSQLNKSYAEYVEELQRNKWDIIEQLRQSKSQVFRLQAELQSERAKSRRSRQHRKRRSGERRTSC